MSKKKYSKRDMKVLTNATKYFSEGMDIQIFNIAKFVPFLDLSTSDMMTCLKAIEILKKKNKDMMTTMKITGEIDTDILNIDKLTTRFKDLKRR